MEEKKPDSKDMKVDDKKMDDKKDMKEEKK
jgi:hypothetical protein